MAFDVHPPVFRESDKIDIRRIENELEAHQHHDRMFADNHRKQPQAE
jgi:hypothetical protein